MTLFLPVDHVILLVSDPDSAGAAFGKAGFTVTPLARHSAAMGTANRCVMLEGSYIELLGIMQATPANAGWRRLLDKGAGLRGFALRSEDIEASVAELNGKGMATEPVRHFSRPMEGGELRFSIARLDPATTPGYQCLACQHRTPELLWRPELTRHANGARSLLSISTPGARALQALASPYGIPLVEADDRLVISASEERLLDLRESCGIDILLVRA